MQKNSYVINVNGRQLNDFEFIVGPMAAVSIPLPPRAPEEFIMSAFKGGATPIIAPREPDASVYIKDIQQIRSRMKGNYIGANVFGLWKIFGEFLDRFNALEEKTDFLDINGIEFDFKNLIPLLKTVDVNLPLYLGLNQPISVYTFRKYLDDRNFSFLLERLERGTLKLYLPQNRGGGHLPILKKNQEGGDWAGDLIKEVVAIEEEIKLPVPFIVEKGMLTVDDFVETISRYSVYPNFCGVRFASLMEISRESGLSKASKDLLASIIRNKRSDMILPTRSIMANTRNKKAGKVKGGSIAYAVATPIVKKIYELQCDGDDFPKYSRPYKPDVLKHQISELKRLSDLFEGKSLCRSCFKNCPMEYCEMKGAWDGVSDMGNTDDAIIHVSPNIINADQTYINAPADFIIRDLIGKVLSRLNSGNSQVIESL